MPENDVLGSKKLVESFPNNIREKFQDKNNIAA